MPDDVPANDRLLKNELSPVRAEAVIQFGADRALKTARDDVQDQFDHVVLNNDAPHLPKRAKGKRTGGIRARNGAHDVRERGWRGNRRDRERSVIRQRRGPANRHSLTTTRPWA